jgi:hypothetical protein
MLRVNMISDNSATFALFQVSPVEHFGQRLRMLGFDPEIKNWWQYQTATSG